MATVTFAQAMASLGVTKKQLNLLMSNSSFPAAVSNDGAGTITFTDTDISGFATKMTTAKSNGWTITEADLAHRNWTTAPAAVGGFYQAGAIGDPIDFAFGELGSVTGPS